MVSLLNLNGIVLLAWFEIYKHDNTDSGGGIY
jgi:hypothetical protein